MQVTLSRLILYVHDVEALKRFYQTHFGLDVCEEIEAEWVVMKVGAVELALHRVGAPYRERHPERQRLTNTKIVLSVESGLVELRDKLIAAGVVMRELKRYEGFSQLMCDGEDPEGNVFQLSQSD
jgi:predicted enzyme related to lactoylglutathione lyase